MTAITSTPDVRGGVPCVAGTDVPVFRILADIARTNMLHKIATRHSLTIFQLEFVLAELTSIYSQPPEPSASIEEAAKDIIKTLLAPAPSFWPEQSHKETQEILHRHFATASRAERAWEIWLKHQYRWQVLSVSFGSWGVVTFAGVELARDPDPITAILRAAGEGEDDANKD